MNIKLYFTKLIVSAMFMLFTTFSYAQSSTPIEVCVGSQLKLAVNYTTANPDGPAGSTYDWSITGDQTFLGTATPATNKYFITWDAGDVGKTFTIQVTETANGCIGETKTYVVRVNTTPVVPTLTVDNATICSVSDAIFTVNGTPGTTVEYTLNGNAASVVIPTSGTITIDASATTLDANRQITMVITNVTLGSCAAPLTAVISQTITVNETPVTSEIIQID